MSWICYFWKFSVSFWISETSSLKSNLFMVSSTPWSVDSRSALSFDLFQILTFMFILCIPGAVQVVSDMIMMMMANVDIIVISNNNKHSLSTSSGQVLWLNTVCIFLIHSPISTKYYQRFLTMNEIMCESYSVVSDSLWRYGLYRPWNSLGQNTEVGNLSLLQGIFPTQASNPSLLHCGQILYQLSHKGSLWMRLNNVK